MGSRGEEVESELDERVQTRHRAELTSFFFSHLFENRSEVQEGSVQSNRGVSDQSSYREVQAGSFFADYFARGVRSLVAHLLFPHLVACSI